MALLRQALPVLLQVGGLGVLLAGLSIVAGWLALTVGGLILMAAGLYLETRMPPTPGPGGEG